MKHAPLFIVLLVMPVAALGANKVSATRPHILFILTNDQGYGDVGRHGNPALKTPNLDALHDQSVQAIAPFRSM